MKNPGFIKRMIVVVYDGLLMAGVVLVGYLPVYGILTLLPESVANGIAGNALKVVYLVAIPFAFYGWFWTHGGQTLGMRAWHLYLITPDGKFPGWRTAAVRYVVAICSWALVPAVLKSMQVEFWYLATGLGFSWMLLNPARLTWHDLLSNTRIVRVPPKKP